MAPILDRKRHRTRLVRALSGVGIAALLATAVVACTPTGGDGGSGDGSGIFSMATLEPDHLTAGQSVGSAAAWVQEALYAPLVTYGENGEINGGHAESVTSDDLTVWTIKLKPGWTFHNGDPITAQDYANTINYAAVGANGWGSNYLTQEIEGYADLNPAEGEPTATELSGLDVVDDNTLVVTLSRPFNDWPLILAYSASPFRALPAVAFDDLAAFDEAPIGSGPFKMDGVWNHNTDIKMVRFEEYQGGLAASAGIDFLIYQTPDAAYTDLLAGNVDVVGGAASIPTGRLTQVISDVGEDNVAYGAQLNTMWLGLPVEDPRLDDIRVRQAISLAIDREGISQAIYGGFYEPATGLLGSGFKGFPTGACGEFCEFDPERAAALLEEAGGLEGELTLYYPADILPVELYEAIANGLTQNLGITVKLNSYPTVGQWLEGIDGPGLTGPIHASWGSATPGAGGILRAIFTCGATYSSEAGDRCSEATDELILGAGALPSDEGVENYRQAEALIFEDQWIAPLLWYSEIYAFSTNVTNVATLNGSTVLNVAAIETTD